MKFSFLALLKPLIIFVIGLLDDALLIALSQVGLRISWLQWLAPVILCCTVLHCVVQLLRHRSHSLTSSSTCSPNL